MREVLDMLPTVVFAAKDRKGRDLTAVRVALDGRRVTDELDGKAVAVDPGVHHVRYEAKDAPPVFDQIVVRQGEKNRLFTITVPIPADPAPAAPTARRPQPPETRSPPFAALAVGGLGLALGGLGLWLLVDSNADARELRDTCAPRCAQADVDAVSDQRLLSGVAFAAGGVALVASVVLLLTRGTGSSSSGRVAGAGR
jgi:hypothetical protein